ncbi:hypothetical protein [Brachyspira catarrhinii]|uniref:Uncharacterized protein n=1 Tax=Brachyspira catarrhinii TaxID=2528966 RepID=A0ABY2TQD8_9SPIR|nr:hypothetical protein [Brachyspira catarrhinii]TKZ34543.1 hypothetical protein EZH24_07655 [Brachyspira catarrhinii]
MGFFSDLWDFACDCVGGVVEAVSDIKDAVVDFFSGTKTKTIDTSTHVVKNMPEEIYDQRTATINQTMEMNKFLDETRDKYRKILHDKEEATIKYARDIFDKILKEVDKKIIKSNDNKSININDIDIKFNQSIYDFRNTFSSTILDKITLSNGKCEDILKIEDTSTKRKKMENYLNGLIDDALDNFCKGIDDITKNTISAIEDNINRVLSNHKESIKNIEKELNENMKLKDDEIEKKRKEYDRREKIIKSLIA